MPSLKPNRLRGVDCAVEVDDVRPKPSCDQRTATVPKPIRARLRIACTATCGSSAQAWTQRSPSDRAGSRLSAGKCGSVRSAVGLPVGEAEAVLAVVVAEQRRAEAEGDRQPGGRQPDRLAGVVGRQRRTAPSIGPTVAGAARRCVIRSAASVQCLQQRDQLVAGVGGDVEGREVQPVLGRGDDAGLVRAAEGVRRATASPVGAGVGPGAPAASRDRRRTRRPPRRRPRRRR